MSLEAELARLEDEVAALDWGAPGKVSPATANFVGSNAKRPGGLLSCWPCEAAQLA